MENNLKCPICGNDLLYHKPTKTYKSLYKSNCCCSYDNSGASLLVWKALEMAICILKEIKKEHTGTNGELYSCSRDAAITLEKIENGEV